MFLTAHNSGEGPEAVCSITPACAVEWGEGGACVGYSAMRLAMAHCVGLALAIHMVRREAMSLHNPMIIESYVVHVIS